MGTSGGWVKSCSILTTTPNAVTSAVHDRMPVILDPDAYDLWLDPGMNDVAAASDLLKPFDARLMRCYPVSTRINSVVNDDEECSKRVELVGIQAVTVWITAPVPPCFDLPRRGSCCETKRIGTMIAR